MPIERFATIVARQLASAPANAAAVPPPGVGVGAASCSNRLAIVVAPPRGGRLSLRSSTWSRRNASSWSACSAASSRHDSGIRPTTSQPEMAAPWRAASSRINASTRWIGVASVFNRFMLTWARRPPSIEKPRARTCLRPPLCSRIERAIARAIRTSPVFRLALNATRNRRAPTAVAPAVGWMRGGPKSGARSGSLPIRSRNPSNSPRRTSARLVRPGRVAAAS